MLGKPFKPTISRHDRIIQATDLDALSFKFSAHTKGYLNDKFVDALVQEIKDQSPKDAQIFNTLKLPLINIGTYIRTRSIDELCNQFVERCEDGVTCQIISLGAGSDTRPFKMLEKYSTKNLIYHELDFSASTQRKRKTIVTNNLFRAIIGPITEKTRNESTELHTNTYHLHATDLRLLAGSDQSLLQDIREDIPTLVVSECCLCYMEPDAATNLLAWLAASFKSQLAFVIYEPMSLNDSFGRVMTQNLAVRGISLPTMSKYPTLESQIDRLCQMGLSQVHAEHMQTILTHWLVPQETERIRQLEFLDEWEELDLLLQHYCLVWGSRFQVANWTGRGSITIE